MPLISQWADSLGTKPGMVLAQRGKKIKGLLKASLKSGTQWLPQDPRSCESKAGSDSNDRETDSIFPGEDTYQRAKTQEGMGGRLALIYHTRGSNETSKLGKEK